MLDTCVSGSESLFDIFNIESGIQQASLRAHKLINIVRLMVIYFVCI